VVTRCCQAYPTSAICRARISARLNTQILPDFGILGAISAAVPCLGKLFRQGVAVATVNIHEQN